MILNREAMFGYELNLTEWHTIVFVTLLFCIFVYRDRPLFVRRCDSIKGPKGLPLIGNTLQVVKDAARPLQAMQKRSEIYGLPNTMTLIGMGRAVNITRPDWIEYIQKTNFSNYVKGSKLRDCLYDLLGDGIFNTDGHSWKAQRKVGSNIMTVSNLKTLVTQVLYEESERFIRELHSASAAGISIDLPSHFFSFTMATFLKIAFSTDLQSMQGSSTGTSMSFAKAFDLAQTLSVRRLNRPWWRLTKAFSKEERQLKEAIAIIDSYVFSLIQQRRKEKRGAGSPDLLDLFLRYRNQDRSSLSDRQLRDALLNFLLAGRDTTAESLSWASFELLKNPNAIQKIRSEIRDSDITLTNAKPEEVDEENKFGYDHTKKLHYTRAVYHESLRLHPSVPRASKISINDDILPGNIFIPARTTVIWSDWLLARNKEVWGDDAEVWRPERWIQDNTFVPQSQWKFHSFNGGPRLCLGIQLAQYQGMFMLSRIFTEFDLSLESDMGLHFEPEVENTLTLPMKDPLMVRVYPRQD